jgi:hypothetical protein
VQKIATIQEAIEPKTNDSAKPQVPDVTFYSAIKADSFRPIQTESLRFNINKKEFLDGQLQSKHLHIEIQFPNRQR